LKLVQDEVLQMSHMTLPSVPWFLIQLINLNQQI